MSEQATIRPEILAAKMAAVANFRAPRVSEQLKTHPRLFELLWFIQGMSTRPGGLVKFCEDFLLEFADRVGTPAMHTAPAGKTAPGDKATLSAKDREAIMLQIPRYCWQNTAERQQWLDAEFWNNVEPGGFQGHLLSEGPDDDEQAAHRRCVAALHMPPSIDKSLSEGRKRALAFIAKLDRPYFFNLCHKYALLHLPGHFARACNEPESPLEATWYFNNLLDALFQMMDSRAAKEFSTVAETEISLKIRDAMKYAGEERALVSIAGDPRTGKTTTAKTYCAAWPGKARLVSVPCSNSDADLFKAFADALGIEYTFRTNARELKATVEFVIQHCGLLFALDESHWLFPARFSANTPPMRLNWLRSVCCDKQCPIVLLSTPQEFNRCQAKYVKATSHRIEQFMGRKMLDIILPSELEEADLWAVARIHFPDLSDDFLQVIVGSAMRAEGYLMTIEALAKRVRYIARRDGHKTVTLANLKLAMSEIMPAPPAPKSAPAVEPPRPEQQPLATKRNIRPMRPIRPAATAANPAAAQLEAPVRSITPATNLEPV